MGVVAGTANAHPFGDRYAAQRIDVALQADGLDVVWRADAPRALLPQNAQGLDTQRMHAELSAGLIATLDGETLTPTDIAVTELPELTTEHGVGVEVALHYTADFTGDHELVVSNGNLQGTPSYHLIDARLPAGTHVHSSSLWAEPQGLRRIDLANRWSRAESRRRFSLAWTWPTSLSGRLWDALGAPQRPLSALQPQPWWTSWWTGQETPPTFAIAWLGHVAVGALCGVSRAGRRTAPLAAAAAVGAILWGRLGVGGTLFGLALAAGVDPRLTIAVACASWDRPWSPVLAAAACLGVVLGRGPVPASRRRVVAALLVTAALATHGVGAVPPSSPATPTPSSESRP